MAEEMVNIGCRLPNGYRLEVGFSVNQEGKGGAPFAMFTKAEDYQAVVLKGLNQQSIIRDETGKPFAVKPSQIGREPVVTPVPKAFWDRWVKEHSHKDGRPKAWALKTGQIFVIPNAASAKAATLDAKAKGKQIFEPVDRDAVVKIEDHSISRRIDED